MADMNGTKRPNGAAAAALLSAGIGTAIFGIATVGAEMSQALRAALAWSGAVGPLSGKTSVGLIAWLASWLILGLVWKGKDARLVPVVVICAVLLVSGLLGTFPPFFKLFAPE